MRANRAFVAVCLVVALGGCDDADHSSRLAAAPVPAAASSPGPADTRSAATASAADLYAKISRSVVLVLNPAADLLGSGVEIGRGQFVTNCHVLAHGDRYLIQRDQRRVVATLLRAAPEHDICLLSADVGESFPAEIRSAGTLKVGERVYALGNPQGLEQTFSEGIVSQLRKGDDAYPYIQTTAPISQGSSGGGLFDADGRLIGIPSFMYREGQNLNFAAPIDWAVALVPGSSVVATIASGGLDDASPAQDVMQPGTQPDAQPDAQPDVLNQTAIGLIKAGKVREAIPLLEQATQVAAGDAELWGNLGYAHLVAGDYAAAQDALETSLQLAPERAASWLNLGQTLAGLGSEDLAVDSVVKGYGFASRKASVLAALRAASSDPTADIHWRHAAAAAVARLDPATPTDATPVPEQPAVESDAGAPPTGP